MDPITATLVLVRWVHFGAMFVLFGTALFFAYAPGSGEATRRFCRRAVRLAAPVALATGAGWLAATIVNMTGGLDGLADPDTLHAFFLQTIFGPIEAARLALLLLLVALAVAPLRDGRRFAAVAVASGLLLASQAWLGHAAEGGATREGAAMIASYAVHVLAGAAWLGGLPPLLARIAELRRDAAPPAALLQLLSRFSLMATAAVLLILASGLANTAFRVRGDFGRLWPTPYGEVLLAKLGLVGLLLAFAAANRFVAMPRLRASAAPIGPLVASVGVEIILGALVLAAAAILGITPPP